MDFSVFEKIISDIKACSESERAIYKAGIDLINYSDSYNTIISLLLKAYYGKSGEEWISWFLYDRGEDDSYKAYDKEGNEICRNVKELWELVESEKPIEDYKFPPELSDEQKAQYLRDFLNIKRGL